MPEEATEIEAKCPKCNAELDSLICRESGTANYIFSLWKDRENWEFEDFESDGNICIYSCPECGEVVATDSVDAAKILGKKEE